MNNKILQLFIVLFLFAVVIIKMDVYAQSPTNTPITITINNQGGSMEGHTPRGFSGIGTGLFIGDNLNLGFPDGDGLQMFLTFNLENIPKGIIVSAILSSQPTQIQGSPFKDLGALTVREIRYSNFSKELWNIQIDNSKEECVFADSKNGPFQCDMKDTVQQSLNDGYQYAQFLFRFDQAGDSDGKPDMVNFYNTNPNTNEAGIFKLTVSVVPDELPKAEKVNNVRGGNNEKKDSNIFGFVIAIIIAIGVLVLSLKLITRARRK